MRDPLAGSSWSAASTVAGFVRAESNATLLRFAEIERLRTPTGLALDIGCGAGRNAVPLAHQGWRVLGTDLSWPMLAAARDRVRHESVRLSLALAPMDALPVRARACDLVVVHGIWNLARSMAELRRAIEEASRVAAPDAALFVFTFSRSTLPPDAPCVAGEPLIYTQFSGQPQCFLTREQLLGLMAEAGFAPDAAVAVTEHNLPPAKAVHAVRAPVILEAAFRRIGR
jgi:ubiquinone/menaquinone biosynthesis C-methylase UbiE